MQEQTKAEFPVTMGVNAFRGFLNEFMAQTRVEHVKTHKTKRKKEKKRKTDEVISHVGHHFVLTIINIPTACEICTSFFMWPLERGLVCQSQSLHLSLFYLTPITQRDSITTLRQGIFNYKSFLFVTIVVVWEYEYHPRPSQCINLWLPNS